MQQRFGGGVAPVKVGEELDVKIEGVGEKGDGIAKVKGFVLFVANTNEGDEVRVRVTRVLRKVGFADVIGEAAAPVESDAAPAEEPQAEPEDAPEEQAQEAEEPAGENPKDSEDFGEEPEEEKKEE